MQYLYIYIFIHIYFGVPITGGIVVTGHLWYHPAPLDHGMSSRLAIGSRAQLFPPLNELCKLRNITRLDLGYTVFFLKGFIIRGIFRIIK